MANEPRSEGDPETPSTPRVSPISDTSAISTVATLCALEESCRNTDGHTNRINVKLRSLQEQQEKVLDAMRYGLGLGLFHYVFYSARRLL